MYSIYFYKTQGEDYPVKDFLYELDKKSRAKIWRYIDLLKEHGPDLLRPYADTVRDKIRELRIPTTAGNVRIFYFFVIDKNIILLHAFKKKTQELPDQEINKAINNMKDFIYRLEKQEFSI